VVGEATDGVEAIRTVAAGEALLPPSITRRLTADFVAREPARAAAAPPTDLTAREADVLRLLAAGKSNAEIAEELLIGHSTVKPHVNRLLTELDLRDRAPAVVCAHETRFVQPGA
jgi:DNA-binding NarL/FixJ family response regulator